MTTTDDSMCPYERPEDTEGTLEERLARAIDQRRRAECSAHIQSHTVQLALDLLVREPDLKGFFRGFIQTLIENGDSQACGVFLLEEDGRCQLHMAYVGGEFFGMNAPGVPGPEMSAHLVAYTAGWKETIEYLGDDPRLPESVRAYNATAGLRQVVVTPLILPTHNLGWIALSTIDPADEPAPWRVSLLEACAKHLTLALHQSRLAKRSRDEARHQAVLEERNRIARDIHDTLAQGFAAILMQLQSTQRMMASALPPNVARSIDAAIDLARTHMIEARRSVGVLRPQQTESGDVASLLERTVDLARRTTDVPIEFEIEELPPLGAGMEREIAGIAQEALTNAIRHSRARRIKLHATATRSIGFRMSVADDGRGIAKERFGSGFGLTSMQERAERIGASLTIVTAPRAGTEVVLAWEPPSFSIPTAP